jgi:plasmid stabilization system protein ParE
MSYALSIHPEASAEFYDSVGWYEAQSPGLGERFKQEVMSTLRAIAEKPEIGSYIKGTYRQAGVPVFPFVIVYKVAGKQQMIYVSAIFHTSRRPAKKFRRQSG